MGDTILSALFGALVAGLGILLLGAAWENGRHSVATECQKTGVVIVGNRVLDCKVRSN